MAFATVTTAQLKQWAELINSCSNGPAETGFLFVSDFLKSSGQGGLAHQGEALEQQVQSLRESQQTAASVVISLLGTYISLASQYPATKLENHR